MKATSNRVSDFLHDVLNLHHDKAEDLEIIESIKSGVDVRGTNLWILVFAIFVASVGLNVNSTAVIIGAMLISPLMGPIMGIGLGLGISAVALVKKSYRHLMVMVGFSLLASTLYFLITPLSEARSELLARTYPTVWDVLIALFGGMAGIVGATRKSKGNVIPGVAIATALMPPLCTAGYGLAIGSAAYFFGALYLFFINSVMIAFSTWLFVRLLKLPRVDLTAMAADRKASVTIYTIVILTSLPSIYLAYSIVTDTLFQQNVNRFVKEELAFPDTEIVSRRIERTEAGRIVDVFLVGERVSQELLDQSLRKLPLYKLSGVTVRVHQGGDTDSRIDVAHLKSDLLETLYQRSLLMLERKNRDLDSMRGVLASMTAADSDDIARELGALNPKVSHAAISRAVMFSEEGLRGDTIAVALLKARVPMSRSETRSIENWLRVRTGSAGLRMLVER